MREEAVVLIDSGGELSGLYTELVPLHELGRMKTRRATLVEFCEEAQEWQVRKVGSGAVLFGHESREACLEWERRTFSNTRTLRKLRKKYP